MRRLILFSLLASGIFSGCNKEPDEKPDYSQTIYQSDPSWERVATVPWYGIANDWGYVRQFTVGDLQLSSSGTLMLAYGQYTEGSPFNGYIELPVYRAIAKPGNSTIAGAFPAGFATNGVRPLYYQHLPTDAAFGCTQKFGDILIRRSDGAAGAEMSNFLAPESSRKFLFWDLGPRYLPRFHGSGDLLFDNDALFGPRYTAVYSSTMNRWLEVEKPLLPAHDWFSYQTSDGVTGFCGLSASNDSLFISIYRLNAGTQNFDSVFTQALPEFSGKGVAMDCRLFGYNDEGPQLVAAVARYGQGQPLEASAYTLQPGTPRFDPLYISVSLPAAVSGNRFADWGNREDDPGKSAGACTPDGQLYDLMRENNTYYLVTVDAAGVHEKARFLPNETGTIARWPLFYLGGSFYLLAQNTDHPAGKNKNFRMEILRVR